MEWKTFTIDKAHANIGFQVTHMMLAKVRGRFEEYTATIAIQGQNFETAKINFVAQTHSINTYNEERDKHLRSSDFFYADVHREVTFVSSSVRNLKDNTYIVEGFLTMHGLTNHLKLNAELSKFVKDEEGNTRFGISMKSKINRFNWNIKWNQPLQSGGILVSKEVLLDIEAEFIG